MKRLSVVLLVLWSSFVMAQMETKLKLRELENLRLNNVKLRVLERYKYSFDIIDGKVSETKKLVEVEKFNSDGLSIYNKSTEYPINTEVTRTYEGLLIKAEQWNYTGAYTMEVTKEWTYDENNRIKELNTCTNGKCSKSTYTYDKKTGNLIKESASFPNPTWTYSYDANNNVSKASAKLGSSTYTYDEKGDLKEQILSVAMMKPQVMKFEYNDKHLATRLIILTPESKLMKIPASICSDSWEWDKNGNKISETRIKDDTLKAYCVYVNKRELKYELLDIVQAKVNNWQVKSKFETTTAYQQRVTEANRMKQVGIITQETINQFGKENKPTNAEYDAENETFKINFEKQQPIILKVPKSEAESFETNIKELQFDGQYSFDGESIALQKGTIKNPANNKEYNYDSNLAFEYHNIEYNLEFEPIDVSSLSTGAGQQPNNVAVNKSDVDINIPQNSSAKNSNTFVVIIANENYQKEVAVKFAINDGSVFKEYCKKTLGIPDINIHFAPNATFGNIKSELKWISDVAKAYKGDAKIIFYYAGHGMPNEQTKSAYLLPVDGFSSDFETSIKLDDIYSRLAENPTKGITVFMDACFSGSQRDNGMLAEARGVKIKPKDGLLSGPIVVISAATGDETAFPYKEKEHGLFTYFLLKKLQESNGETTYKDLFDYIELNVKQQSIVVNQKSQTPQVNSGIDIKDTWQQFKLN